MYKKDSAGRLIWRIIYPLLIFLAAEFIVELVAILMYVIPGINNGIFDGLTPTEISEKATNYIYKYNLYITIARGLILIPAYFLFMRGDVKLDKRLARYTEYGQFNKAWLLMLIPVGFGAAIGFNGLITLTGIEQYSSTYQEVAQIQYSGSIYIEILASAVVAPLVEELLFRGLIYKRLRNNLKPIWCMIISAAIFGIIHGNIVQFLYAFLVGILFAYVYEKFKTIWAPVIFHASANFISIVITELVPGDTITIGTVMLVSVIALAITFVVLRIIDIKFNRKEV